MRLLLLLLLVTTIGYTQDSLLLDYINIYRTANGLNVVKYDSNLHAISKLTTNKVLLADSMSHSGTNTYECITRVHSIAPTSVKLDGFNKFLKKYYNNSYVTPIGGDGEPMICDCILLYVVYMWDSSSEHRKILLKDDVSFGSCSINIGEIKFIPNYRVIGGNKIYFNKFISHYKVDIVSTLNLK